MKPSLSLYCATQRHLTRLVPRPSLLGGAKQLRRASVVHSDLVPLIPHQVRNLQQAPPAAPASPSAAEEQQQQQTQQQTQGLGIADKYRDKLLKKARAAGVGDDVDALRAACREKIAAVKRRDAEALPTPPPSREASPSPDSPTSSQSSSSSSSSSSSPSSPSSPPTSAIKPLSSILDLDKVRALPNTELSAIWRLRYAQSPTSLCATIPSPTYLAMERLARRATPQFVLPVPHEDQGAELHFMQWTFGDGSAAGAPATTTSVLFTRLAEYKLNGEFAQPHTTVTHHLDLAAERGLVLMEGAVVEGRGTTVEQAHWLVMCLQRFYGALEDGEAALEGSEPAEVAQGRRNRRQLVEWFGKGDSRFSVDMLLQEAQRVG